MPTQFSIDAANANANKTGAVYAPDDPRATLAPLQNAYDVAQSAAMQPIPEAPLRPAGGFSNSGDAVEFRNAMRAHNQAVSDAKNYSETAKYMHDALHQAQVHADAGDFHAAVAKIPLDDPALAEKMTALLAKHPGSASDPGVQDTLNMRLTANQRHIQNREAQYKDEVANHAAGTKIIQEGLADGTILPSDLQWDPKDPNAKQPGFIVKNPITGRPQFDLENLATISATRTAQGIGSKAAAKSAQDRKDAIAEATYLAKAQTDMTEGTPEYAAATARMAELNKSIMGPSTKRAGTATVAPGAAPAGTPAPKSYTPGQYIIKH